MKMRVATMPLFAALMLCGCDWGSSVELENQAGSIVAAEIRRIAERGDFVRPGRWQTRLTVDQVDATGIAPAALTKIKSAVGKPSFAASCLTPDQVKRGGFYVGEENKACRYERFAMGGGKISGVLRCADAQGTRSMSMRGSYTPERYQLIVSSDARAAGQQGQSASVTMTMDARRDGECTGKEAQEMPKL